LRRSQNQKSLQVPEKLDGQHQPVAMLSDKSGTEFNAAYMNQMTSAQAKAVALFERASRVSDTDLAAFARKTLLTLRDHEQMAENLNASLGQPRARSAS
jgi:putative membrane protein